MRRQQVLLAVMLAIGVALPAVVWAQKKPAKSKSKAQDAQLEKWAQGVSALPGDKQLAAVMKKLQELNPGYDGREQHQDDDDGHISWLALAQSDKLTDISPVRALSGLKDLMIVGSKVSDLTPLQGLPLQSLHFAHTQVSDLAPLAGMPLTQLNCFNTKVADLSPLKGMQLTELNCYKTNVADLSPLAGMPLATLGCSDTKVSDLGPIKGMPLVHLSCDRTKVSDLTPIEGMSLATLGCGNTKVSDLAPVRGMPLEMLHFGNTKVTDLRPLAGMNLNSIRFTPKNIRQGLDVLRKMEYLDRIYVESGQEIKQYDAEEFWKQYDSGALKK